MLKIAKNLLFVRSRRPRFFFTNSTPNNKPQQKEQAENLETKKQENIDREYNQYEEEEPKYQKEDRTTPGWILYRLIFWSSTAILGYNVYLVSQHDKKTPVKQQTGAIYPFIDAAQFIYENANLAIEFFTKPPVNKLLPDPIHPNMHPKTLVLNVSGTLLQTEYEFGKGLIINKRPGLSQFLAKMAQIYQIVIFSDDDPMFLNCIMPSIDPLHQFIAGYFGHECMVFSKGKSIKDLKYLNRDLKKVIVIDKTKETTPKQNKNVIVLSSFEGDANDRELIVLGSLLQSLSKQTVKDVRKSIQELGEEPIKMHEKYLKEKQQKIKEQQNSGFFSIFGKKK